MTILIRLLYFFLFLSSSTAISDPPITLTGGAPTTPTDLVNANCCMPIGSLTLTIVDQIQLNGTIGDIVNIQAPQWEGLLCTSRNYTEGTVVQGVTVNTSTITTGIMRILWIIDNPIPLCSETLYEVMPNGPSAVYLSFFGVFNGLSTLACIWLFYCYIRIEEKNVSLKLIFTLTMSDFLYHLTAWIWEFLVSDSQWLEIISVVGAFSRTFSIYWSTTMSIIFMKALTQNPLFSQFVNKTWFLSILPSCFLSAW